MAYIVNTGHLPLSKNGRQHARASPGRSQPITWEASFVRGAESIGKSQAGSTDFSRVLNVTGRSKLALEVPWGFLGDPLEIPWEFV
jgi:hypothetical protein